VTRTGEFEQLRPLLFSIAYRILGSVSEAEDAVQETWLRYESSPTQPTSAKAFLSAAVTLGWAPEPGRFHLFAVTISEVTFIRYDDATGDQHVAQWPPPREFIRRGTTATSLGAPEPAHHILVPDPGPP
jgi:hypothetical protein